MSQPPGCAHGPSFTCRVCAHPGCGCERVPTRRGDICIWCAHVINRWAQLSPLVRKAIELGAVPTGAL
jgi:hypothetical protein